MGKCLFIENKIVTNRYLEVNAEKETSKSLEIPVVNVPTCSAAP